MPFPLLIPTFFFSSWLLMIFSGMVSPDVGVATVGYTKAMLVTIGLWLVVFPLVRKGKDKGRGKFDFKGQIGDEIKQGFSSKSSSKTNSNTQTLADDEVDITSSFSGISRRLTSQNFRGGNVNTNFGGVQLDMTEVALAGNEAKLTVRAFVGGVEVTVPEGWDVQTDVSTTVGGVSDERTNGGSHEVGAPKLVITGSATLGGLSIKD